MRLRHALSAIALALVPAAAGAESLLAGFEKKVTEHHLPNGWTFLIIEEHQAPVVSFFTHVNVGAAQERYGITGLAHMFEHMAFKGTSHIGTRDPKGEQAAIDALEGAFNARRAEAAKPSGGDPDRRKALEKAFQDAQAHADTFVIENEFGEIIDREGGVGLNAFTSSDQTGYFFSLPANKLELWAYLESERFLDPVFRDFYKERDVVKEERRMRTESQPFGRLFEEFLGAAFKAHPYGHPVVGHMSDLDSFTMTDAKEFHRKYYTPSNMVTTIIGDVTPAAVIPVLTTYFGRIPRGQPDEPLRTVEPPQVAERQVTLLDKAQPIFLEGYHVPRAIHADTPAIEALAQVLGQGRTSRLYRDLVRDQKVAAGVSAFRGLPGDKYPGLFGIQGVPTPGHNAREMAAAIRQHIDKLKKEPVTDQELQQVKSRAKADLVRQLDSVSGLAFEIAIYQALTGDWRDLFRDVDRIDKVTAADIQRVANEYLKPENRTVGMIVNDAAELAR